MIIGGKSFEVTGHTYVMGILNVTPDSFSDGGQHFSKDEALFHARNMIMEGADVLDIGGESTRPGHIRISDNEEIERVVPIIEAIKSEFDVPVSIDTYKSKVLEAALSAGADMANDIWGLKYDDKYAKIVADYGVPYILMHNRDNPVSERLSLIEEIGKDIEESLRIAKEAGIRDDRIILDPGVGFGKTYEHNLMVLAHESYMMPKGYPILLGTSRKSVIGFTLDLPVEDRLEGTLATTVMAAMNGCMFVRVHDIKANVRAIKMTEGIINYG